MKDIVILYEDNHLIAVNKPAGILVHSDETGDITMAEMVKGYIKRKYNKPGDVFLGVIHRLDRPVSGVLIFARTSKALVRMNQLLKDHLINKSYHAVTSFRPREIEERLTHFILKDTAKNISKALTSQKKGAKKAILDYELIREIDHNILLNINPITGRSHQIRAQLKAIGTPIIGDLKYGYPTPNKDKSICLHCRSMSFIHPVLKKEITIKAAYPKLPIWRIFN
jgi:23S rRNA pseudouridine1911/1915/1917 synthase